MITCKIILSHVAIDLEDADETVEHIIVECPEEAVAIIDIGDDDETTVCMHHLVNAPEGSVTIERFDI